MTEDWSRISTAPSGLREWSQSIKENITSSRLMPEHQVIITTSPSEHSLHTPSTLLSDKFPTTDEFSSPTLPITTTRPSNMSTSECLESMVFPECDTSLPPSICESRLLWSQESTRDGTYHGGRKSTSRGGSYPRRPFSTSGKRVTTLTKYTKYPNFGGSRSLAEGEMEDSSSPLLKAPPSARILSMSGTPEPVLGLSLPTFHPSHISVTPASISLLDSLLRCLFVEKRKAGGYFQKHLELLEDKTCLHCLLFWREVQEYKTLFVGSCFSPTTVETKAKSLYSQFIGATSHTPILTPPTISVSVLEHLWPAFDDLFNEAEEHALATMMEQWKELCALDQQIFSKLQYTKLTTSEIPSSARSIAEEPDEESCSDIDFSEEEEEDDDDDDEENIMDDEEIDTEFFLPEPTLCLSMVNGVSTTPCIEQGALSTVTLTSNHNVSEQTGDIDACFEGEGRDEDKQEHGVKMNEYKVDADKPNGDELGGIKFNGVELDRAKLKEPKPNGVKLSRRQTPEIVNNEDAAKREMSFRDVLQNPVELEHFKMFLNDRKAAVELMCWMEIESLRALPIDSTIMRDVKAKQIRKKYFTRKYFFGPGSPASKQVQREVVAAGGTHRLPRRPKTAVLREAQKLIRARIEKKWVPMFTRTPEFIERNSKQNEKGGSTHKEKEKTVRFDQVTESRDSLLLQKALHNPSSRELFKRFVSITATEGTHRVNNVEFWLEVKRFKEMFHAHMNTTLLQGKMKVILNCYIHSQSVPHLQVDLSPQVVEQLKSKRFGPYIFREAQNEIYRQLQACWQDYQNFCSDVPMHQLPTALDHLQEQVKAERLAQEQREKRMMEEKEREEGSTTNFHFESGAEKKMREEKKMQEEKEKELREYEETRIVFSLSKPNIKYLCHEQIAELQEEACSKESVKTDATFSGKKHLTDIQTRQTPMERSDSVSKKVLSTMLGHFSRPVGSKISNSSNLH